MTQPPFIRRVGLDNFKSVRSQQIDLAPLTVVVGRNSAGKSTLIQSLLAAAQAAAADHSQGLIALNGPLTKLGTYGELKNFRAGDQEEVIIGLTADVFTDEPSLTYEFETDDELFVINEYQVTLSAHLTQYGSTADSRSVVSRLRTAVVPTTRLDLDEVVSLDATSEGVPGSQPNQLNGYWKPDNIVLRDFQFTTGQLIERLEGTVLEGIVPAGIHSRTTVGEHLLRIWWSAYEAELEEEIRIQKRVIADQQMTTEKEHRPNNDAPKRALRDLFRLLPSHGDGPYPSHVLPSKFVITQGSGLSEKGRSGIARSMAGLGEIEFRHRAEALLPSEDDPDDARSWGRRVWDSAYLGRPQLRGYDIIDRGHQAILSALTNVKYLGPIRSPDWAAGPSITDIGSAGEYAPTVLRARASDSVEVPVPYRADQIKSGIPDVLGLPEWAWIPQPLKVADALDQILQFLDLVDAASARDHGRFGVGFSVQPSGVQAEVDLTAVGVGVSQALPIALLLVLSQPGDLILIEQPELHLHPAMQLRMADLLMNYARQGRQVIVETHSEHIVNRLRRRVVEHPDLLQNDIILQFAETDPDSNTVYRPSTINPDGTLSDDWPEGFFEVASDEATELLRALIQQRRKEDT